MHDSARYLIGSRPTTLPLQRGIISHSESWALHVWGKWLHTSSLPLKKGKKTHLATAISIIDTAKSLLQERGVQRLFMLANILQRGLLASQRALMENGSYIRLFKFSRQAFSPKETLGDVGCHSKQQQEALFYYGNEDIEATCFWSWQLGLLNEFLRLGPRFHSCSHETSR